MKCNKCGHDYQGNFCPNCGTPAPGNADTPPHKKKRFRWWYLLIALVIIGVIGSLGKSTEEPSSNGNLRAQQGSSQQSQDHSTQEPVQTSSDAEEPEITESADESDVSDGWTIEQKNAMASAKSYLNYTAFSHDGLIDQLEYEGYSTESATWAADNCGADWNAQALASAKNYLDYTAFSYTGLIDQLEYEKFTTEQATYGVDNCGADWNEQAVKCAKNYLDYTSFSREGLIGQLEYEGFTHEQAVYGVEQNGY